MQKFQDKEFPFKKSGRNSNLHKNLIFGLMYFHALVSNRRNYGIVGWNVPYKFDLSDFEVSCAQLAALMKPTSPTAEISLKTSLQVLGYYVANINYAGKIQRPEDQTTLNAILSDLLTETICEVEHLPANRDRSHYGFPREEQRHDHFCESAIPAEDEFQIFGFN